MNSNDLEEEFTPNEILGLHTQLLLSEISVLQLRIEHHIDRMKYYGELITEDDLIFLRDEMRRIQRDLS